MSFNAGLCQQVVIGFLLINLGKKAMTRVNLLEKTRITVCGAMLYAL